MSPKLYSVGHENLQNSCRDCDPSFAGRADAVDEYTDVMYVAFSQAIDRLQFQGLLRCAIIARKGMSPEEFADELEKVVQQLRAGEGTRIAKEDEIFTADKLNA